MSSFKITLPNGATVIYGTTHFGIFMIQVTPSIFDEDNVEGLCGNPNDNLNDDFTLQGTSSLTENENEFQQSWRFYIYLYTINIFSKCRLFLNGNCKKVVMLLIIDNSD